MLVQAKCTGNAVTGLHVGALNARRYFSRHVPAVELHLDHLRIECGLSPDFWQDRPEIQDRRLCAWLEAKRSRCVSGREPISLSMIPMGENSFKLGPAPRKRLVRSTAL